MMGFRLNKVFQPRAVAATISLGLTLPGMGLAANQNKPVQTLGTLMLSDKVCMPLSAVNHPLTPVEHYLSKQYKNQRTTSISRMLLDSDARQPLTVCFKRAMNIEDNCGMYQIGSSSGTTISLNPEDRVSDILRELISIHEARHIFQRRKGFGFDHDGNVPATDRIGFYFLVEADARMASIIHAHEKLKQGHPQYKAALRNNGGHLAMVEAFDDALREHPRDMNSAIRAGMLAFLTINAFTLTYANSTIDWIDSNEQYFDPEAPKLSLFDRATLTKLGEMGAHGNYMNDTIIRVFKDSFSDWDYQALLTARSRKGQGHACAL